MRSLGCLSPSHEPQASGLSLQSLAPPENTVRALVAISCLAKRELLFVFAESLAQRAISEMALPDVVPGSSRKTPPLRQCCSMFLVLNVGNDRADLNSINQPDTPNSRPHGSPPHTAHGAGGELRFAAANADSKDRPARGSMVSSQSYSVAPGDGKTGRKLPPILKTHIPTSVQWDYASRAKREDFGGGGGGQSEPSPDIVTRSVGLPTPGPESPSARTKPPLPPLRADPAPAAPRADTDSVSKRLVIIAQAVPRGAPCGLDRAAKTRDSARAAAATHTTAAACGSATAALRSGPDQN